MNPRRFFTSDWHLGSFNIINYAKRPFFTASDAARKLVDNCNEAAKWKSDIVFHVGDFWLKNCDRHDKLEDVNELTADVDDYIRFINARLMLLAGNHDDSNCTVDLKSMMLDLNHNYRNVFVTHLPSDVEDTTKELGNEVKLRYHGPVGNAKHIQVNLCGHVHNAWLFKYDSKRKILNYNVGVDVHDYKPVEDVEITQDLDFIFKNIKLDKTFFMSRHDFTIAKQTYRLKVKSDRERRKQERYTVKGLTPEECLRRKVEAMKRKGILR